MDREGDLAGDNLGPVVKRGPLVVSERLDVGLRPGGVVDVLTADIDWDDRNEISSCIRSSRVHSNSSDELRSRNKRTRDAAADDPPATLTARPATQAGAGTGASIAGHGSGAGTTAESARNDRLTTVSGRNAFNSGSLGRCLNVLEECERTHQRLEENEMYA